MEPEFDETEEIGIPQTNRIKRRYTLSEKALEQRKAAARQPKGEGVARNAWKHGRYARDFIQHKIKPCRTSCPKYPCELVEDNETAPGQDCLDKANVLETYRTILLAIQDKKFDAFNERVGLILAQELEVLTNLLEDIQRDGGLVIEDVLDKDGKNIGSRYKPHPALPIVSKLLADLKITPSEYMMTPKELARKETEDDNNTALANLLSSVMGKHAKTNNNSADNDD